MESNMQYALDSLMPWYWLFCAWYAPYEARNIGTALRENNLLCVMLVPWDVTCNSEIRNLYEQQHAQNYVAGSITSSLSPSF